ncbi:MAG: transcription-repair coupling factor [Elusimicrobia bacterium RIFCSPHIGHO2_02_FULL_57_9]|nr:MAG: transcription-repair coupling factor [Elusimicrobia bacterium RIFCSPHIGHO2_02_FULL_57_9]
MSSPELKRITGVPGAGAWAWLARSLLNERPVPGFDLGVVEGPLVLVCRDQGELEDIADAYGALAPLFDGKQEPAACFGEDAQAIFASLEQLRTGARLVLATPEALERGLPQPGEFSADTLYFKVGAVLKRAEALEHLLRVGYRRVDFVESPGEFAVRGAVLDFFGLEPMKAVRVLFEEDSLVSMRVFDPVSQATLEFTGEAKAVPTPSVVPIAAAALRARLKDWTGPDSLWLTADGESGLDFGARPNPPYGVNYSLAWDDMRALISDGYQVLLYSLNRGEDRRVQELLEERGQAGCQFLIGPLRRGFRHPGLKLAVLATSEIFARRYRPASRWRYFTMRGGLRLSELRQGDYVVHQDYGVARYRGLKPVPSPGHGVLDCLMLEFRGSDVLFVPMTEFGRVQRYSGFEGKRPRLSSLDTRKWEEVKKLVQGGVRELARQLLKLQAERQGLPGHAFPPESPMEREFAEAFPYEETPDQARAIADVLADMMSPHPMDRVVIGDVGFGKTEVAMRAAFKCAADTKQAALLVPTTILADQHFHTFCARMADYPVRLGILTRFQTKAEQKKVVEALHTGIIDVVIGTTRLLQKDISFKDLGLVIIDEEHRFGVKDKEKLKHLRKSVDCLALSATPIPRTLNQALSGMRGISLIESAPTGRQPIITKVGPWNEEVVAAAISQELARGGQAYYVHNRVSSLGDCRNRLKALLPTAKFGMVHGQMKAAEIEKAMWAFFNREFDVLVASTIIESGLDIPAVNTLLAEDAHEFGLAQLYQLRGRIGREKRRATCYLFFPEKHGDFSALSEEARKRLEALKEFVELGSGIRLAMRDLEIRGAGDLLGAKQHGFMNAVGVDFYTQMLNEEINRLKGRSAAAQETPVQLDIKLPAFIPADYLPGEMERLEFYKRILHATPEQSACLRRELEDLSGPAPQPVINLFSLLRIRFLARACGVRCVTQKGSHIEVYFRPDASIDMAALSRWKGTYRERLGFLRSPEGDGLAVDLGDEPALQWLEDFLRQKK